ncbi:cell division protein FtsA [bacterium]|nr:cell division protein FtsA [bacterium]
MKQRIVIGLDVGSSNVYAVVGKITQKPEVEIIGSARVPCRGLRNGVVVNIEETTHAIGQAIEEAEGMANTPIKTVYVGIEGGHIESFNHQGAIMISRSDKEIVEEDILRVIDSARAIRLSPEREIIHTLPQGFVVDGQKGVMDPVGMEGSHLGVHVHIVTGDSTTINNLVKCINRNGLEVEDIVLSVLAAAETVVTPEEKDLGCVLIDFGGQTVDLAVFVEGALKATRALPIGSEIITKDIAHCLHVPFAEAERIKKEFGCAQMKMISDNVEINISGMDGKTRETILMSKLCEIIEPRVEEIVTFVREEMAKIGRENLIPAGGILTGGGALLRGVKEITEDILDLPMRLGMPQKVEGLSEVISSPDYTTAIGLIKYAQKEEFPIYERRFVRRKRRSLFRKIKDWFEEVL